MKDKAEDRKGKHHYVPKLHLKYWADSEGRIAVWRRICPGGKLLLSRKNPDAVAYRFGLYAWRGVSFPNSQRIENAVFANAIELQADKVLSKLNSTGLSSLTFDERQWWAVFLNSSVIRLPHILEKIEGRVQDSVMAGFVEAQAEYEALKGDSPQKTLFQWVQEHCPQEIVNLDLEAMLHLLMQEDIINRILSLNWMVIDLVDSEYRLLLGDCPMLQSGRLSQSDALIAMPLSPARLFLAIGDENNVARIKHSSQDRLVLHTNIQSLSTSKVFAFGDANREFVETYFLK